METAAQIVIHDTLQLNSIVWIRSLPEGELGPSRRMYEDLEVLAHGSEIKIEEISVENSHELNSELAKIAVRAGSGLRPIIHFDCHASADRGLRLANGNDLSWDSLANNLRDINVKTENNLVCVFATCFGLHFLEAIQITEPTPWYIMIGAEEEITVRILEDKIRPFYEAAIRSRNISDAFVEALDGYLRLYHCKQIFIHSLVLYICDYASGRSLKSRTENLLSRFLNENWTLNNRNGRRHARRFIKAEIKPNQAMINKFAKLFLIGRKPGIDLKDVRRLVDAEKRRRCLVHRRIVKR